ncbi:MAG: hypothetical protein P4M12_05610 [Gammaproteobacteria bacterium]|nr:hypothetical protein [Gammaproteobacteria bacterium]
MFARFMAICSCLLICIIPAMSQAASCNSVVSQIKNDIQKYNTSIDKQTMPWMKMPWLLKALQEVTPNTVSEDKHDYRWQCPENNENYLSVQSDNDGNVLSVQGEYKSETFSAMLTPKISKPSTVTTVTTVIPETSKPEAITAEEKIIPATSKPTTITTETKIIPVAPKPKILITEKKVIPVISKPKIVKTVTQVIPVTSKPKTVMIGKKEISKRAPTPYSRFGNLEKNQSEEEKQMEQMMVPIVKHTEEQFKTWFNASFKTDNQSLGQQVVLLQKVSLQKTIDFFAKLRACTPGTYNVPAEHKVLPAVNINGKAQSLYYLTKATISGYQDKKCIVKTSTVLSDDVNRNSTCHLTPDSLQFYTEKNAKIGLKADTVNQIDAQDKERLKHIMTDECQYQFVVNPDAQKRITVYLDKLKQCTPGTYKLIERTALITGYKNGKCSVDIYLMLDDKKVEQKCAFSPESVNFIIDNKFAELTASDYESAPKEHDKLIKLYKECQ